jgi:hypothetical protein
MVLDPMSSHSSQYTRKSGASEQHTRESLGKNELSVSDNWGIAVAVSCYNIKLISNGACLMFQIYPPDIPN